MFKFSRALQSQKKKTKKRKQRIKNLTKQEKAYLKLSCLLLNGLQDSWVLLPLFFFLHKTKHKITHSLWTYFFIFFHIPYPPKKGNSISMSVTSKVQHLRALCSHLGLFWSLLLQFPTMKQLNSSKIKLHKHNIYLFFP
jgi:hypothetical protein